MKCAGSDWDWWIRRIMPRGHLIWLRLMKSEDNPSRCRRWIWWKKGEKMPEGHAWDWTQNHELLTSFFWPTTLGVSLTIQQNKQTDQNYRFLSRTNAPEFKPGSKVMTRYHLLPWIRHLKLRAFTYGYGVVVVTLYISEITYKQYK